MAGGMFADQAIAANDTTKAKKERSKLVNMMRRVLGLVSEKSCAELHGQAILRIFHRYAQFLDFGAPLDLRIVVGWGRR